MKKIFSVLIAVIIVALILLGIWFLFFNKDKGGAPEEDLTQTFFPTANNSDVNSPDGQNGDSGNGDNTDEDPSRVQIPKLRQISVDPVAGMVSFERVSTTSDTFINEEGVEEFSTTTEIVFRYIERGTGHMYETKENSLTKTRLSNTTIPKVYNALFSQDGNKLILRYLDTNNETIKTFDSEIMKEENPDPNNPEYSLEGKFLPNDITEFTASPDGNNVLYFTTNNSAEITSVYIADILEDVVSLVYQTPISQWLSQWIDETQIAITTKPHSQVYGYSFLLNTEDKVLTKTVDAKRGLTTLYNQTGEKVIYSISDNRGLATYVQTIGETAFKLNIKTIPEKCAWDPTDNDVVYCATPNILPRGDYPEDWYQGEVSFADNIWRLNTRTFDLRQVYQFGTEDGGRLDVIRPQISPDGRYFMFINKNDLSLWSLDIDPYLGSSFLLP